MSSSDLPLLRGEDLAKLGELCLGDAFRVEGRHRGIDQPAELDHVGERVPE